jgi:hypothetical protein
MKKRIFIIALLLCITLISVTALAASDTRQLTAIFSNIKIIIDNKQISPKDAQGQPVEPFIVNGTTYLPVRAIAEALGKNVKWDDPNKTVNISPKVIGSVNGEDVYDYEYMYYFNSSFNKNFTQYYEALIEYEGVDLLDEKSSRNYVGDMEYYAWQSVVQANLIRQKAKEEYGINLEPTYYEKILEPETVLSIITNHLYTLLTPKLEEEMKASKDISEAAAKAYYNEDPASWDCRKVAHIVITGDQLIEEAYENNKSLSDKEAHDAAKKRAEDIITRLAKGEKFADLALKYSADGTATIGGEMELYFNCYGHGINEKGDFDPVFAAGAFLLKNVGDTSKEPVESSFGFHVIKLLDKKEGFEAVKPFVLGRVQTIDQSEVGEYFQAKLGEWEEEAVVERGFEFLYYVE